jgi:3-oxoacyl-[acyl-carrier protein] reductase
MKGLQEEITALGGSAHAFKADFNQVSECFQLVRDTVQHYQRLDVLVDNAGIINNTPLEGISEESFHKEININLLAPIMLIQEAVKHFPESGGAIVNVSSTLAKAPRPGAGVYGASKAALSNITASFSKELGRRHIRINAVAPGVVETKMHQNTPLERRTMIGQHTPLADRFGEPEEIADVIVFLASEEARWITGRTLTVDGGRNAE